MLVNRFLIKRVVPVFICLCFIFCLMVTPFADYFNKDVKAVAVADDVLIAGVITTSIVIYSAGLISSNIAHFSNLTTAQINAIKADVLAQQDKYGPTWLDAINKAWAYYQAGDYVKGYACLPGAFFASLRAAVIDVLFGDTGNDTVADNYVFIGSVKLGIDSYSLYQYVDADYPLIPLTGWVARSQGDGISWPNDSMSCGFYRKDTFFLYKNGNLLTKYPIGGHYTSSDHIGYKSLYFYPIPFYNDGFMQNIALVSILGCLDNPSIHVKPSTIKTKPVVTLPNRINTTTITNINNYINGTTDTIPITPDDSLTDADYTDIPIDQPGTDPDPIPTPTPIEPTPTTGVDQPEDNISLFQKILNFINAQLVPTKKLNYDDLALSQEAFNHFPLSIPSDFKKMLMVLSAEPRAPVFNFTVPLNKVGFEDIVLTIDLAPFESVAKICKSGLLIMFTIGLIWTSKELFQ